MMGAALAYYCLFSIAPLLLVALTIAGMIFGPNAARGEMQEYLTAYFGESGAQSVQAMLTAVENVKGTGVTALVVGVSVIIFGASSVFNQLKLSLNRIWKVENPPHTGIKAIVINRLFAILTVLVVGLLLISSMLLSAAINRIAAFAAEEVLPFAPRTLQVLDLSVSFFVLTILFAYIFRYLPDVRMGWRNVLLGAVVTSVAFGFGRFLISCYIANSAMTSGLSAAGSVIILLVWIYYSALIFLFGATFTHVYSLAHHLPAEPVADEEPPE